MDNKDVTVEQWTEVLGILQKLVKTERDVGVIYSHKDTIDSDRAAIRDVLLPIIVDRDRYKKEKKVIMDDLRARGLLREACLGCGQWTDERDCGCPAGTSTSLDTSRIIPLEKS